MTHIIADNVFATHFNICYCESVIYSFIFFYGKKEETGHKEKISRQKKDARGSKES